MTRRVAFALCLLLSGCAGQVGSGAETGSLNQGGPIVRPSDGGQFKVAISGMSSQQEGQAAVWAVATKHCQASKQRPHEVAMKFNMESAVTAAHSIPFVNMAAGPVVKQAGELTFKCV
jgi:hypothetical protein